MRRAHYMRCASIVSGAYFSRAGKCPVASQISRSQTGNSRKSVPRRVTAVHGFNMYVNGGSQVVRAYLIYATNGGDSFEEWFRERGVVNNDCIINFRVKLRLL